MTRKENTPKCFYFGSLKGDGHCLYTPEGSTFWNSGSICKIGDCHIDGALAPRNVRIGSRAYYKLEQPSQPVWTMMGESREDRDCLTHSSHEYNQGQFLLHVLPNGFTAISWWDRCQGDSRPGSSSTILLDGIHDAFAMLKALVQHFPQVLDNLEAHNVKLIDVTAYPEEKEAS